MFVAAVDAGKSRALRAFESAVAATALPAQYKMSAAPFVLRWQSDSGDTAFANLRVGWHREANWTAPVAPRRVNEERQTKAGRLTLCAHSGISLPP